MAIKMSKDKEEKIIQVNYRITYEPLPHESIEKLPPPIQDRLEELYELTQTNPDRAIPYLVDLTEKYPEAPVFDNYLVSAYEATGQRKKAIALIEEAYHKHPDYFFAKVNYAFHCLKNNKSENIPDIFEHQFDLKLLYPHRDIFHAAEFISFNAVMALYHLAKAHRGVAEKYYDVLYDLEPNNTLTQKVKHQLYPSIFQRILQKIANNSLKRIKRKRESMRENAKSTYANYSKEF